MTGNKFDLADCASEAEITKNGGTVIKNPDGSVSVFSNNHPTYGNYPLQLTLDCCKALNPAYNFDINTQTCKWDDAPVSCGFSKPINLIVNPKGDDGTLFFVDDFEKETCDLKISFDYLLKIKCEDLLNIINPTVTTNIYSQQTLDQIKKYQMEIENVNTKIESSTSTIYLLNQEYLNTPYSLELTCTPKTNPPVDCQVSAWGDYSGCVKGQKTHTRTIIVDASNGGASCPPLEEVVSCGDTCERPATTRINLITNDNENNLINGSYAAACASLPSITIDGYSIGITAWVTSLVINGFIYVDGIDNTDCQYESDGFYVVFDNGVYKVLQLRNGVIVSLDDCVTTPDCFNYTITVPTTTTGTLIRYVNCDGNMIQTVANTTTSQICARQNTIEGASGILANGPCSNYSTTAKSSALDLTSFNDSAFSQKAADTTLAGVTVYQKSIDIPTIAAIAINVCLTEEGLPYWATILGPARYQAFILGDPISYTCADYYALETMQNDLGIKLFYTCDVPFGTKSDIKLKLDSLMIELTQLNNYLNQLQTLLITAENTYITEEVTGSKGCESPIAALESIDVEMHLDIVNDDNTLTSVFSYPIFPAINLASNLYQYLIQNPNSGFYICGDEETVDGILTDCNTLSLNINDVITPNVKTCNNLLDSLTRYLWKESGIKDYNEFVKTLSSNALASQWLTYTHVISNVTDPDIIAAITNKKIKLSFKINFSCVDFCLLLDNFVLDKSCKSVDRHDITISQNPGFNLTRVIDNKKSWVDSTVPTNREFLIAKSNGTNPIRQTDYDVNDERLVINSKEIDLDICVASAIETDVWCYLNDNPCLLTGCTESILSHIDPFDDIIVDFPTSETYLPLDCDEYGSNDILPLLPMTIEITKCSKIMEFYQSNPFNIIYDNYFYITEDWDGNLGFYIRDYHSFINFSQIYRTQECCESLISVLEVYNNSVPDNEKLVPYWDTHCEKCKVESHKCGDDNLDFHYLVTQPISSVTTIEQFENIMTTQLIDVKNRQTISSYPTLRAVYDRYLHSSDYCDTVSSAFDYQNMDRFAGLVGSYWVDLIEQVVPSTTIWGSVKIYTNTIFDEQKFKYKSYSSLFSNNPFRGEHVLSPINGVDGECKGVNVVYQSLNKKVKQVSLTEAVNSTIAVNAVGEVIALSNNVENPKEIALSSNVGNPKATLTIPKAELEIGNLAIPEITSTDIITVSDNLCIAQMNSGSEFISYIHIDKPISCSNCSQGFVDLSLFTNDIRKMREMVTNLDKTKLYLPIETSGSGLKIVVISMLTDTIITTISLSNDSGTLAYSPDYNKLYVICGVENEIIVIDTITDNVIGSPISLPDYPEKGVYVPYNKCLYVTNYDDGSVTVIDTQDDSIVTTVPVGNGPWEIVYVSDLKRVYVLNDDDGTMNYIKVDTNSVSPSINISNTTSEFIVYYVSHNKRLYVYDMENETLTVINTVDNSIYYTSSDITNGISIDYNPSNKYLYITTGGDGRVYIINTVNNNLVNTVSGVVGSQSIYDSVNNNMYVVGFNGRVTGIDNSNQAVVLYPIPGKSFNGIFNSINNSIYVSSPIGVTILRCIGAKQTKGRSMAINECKIDPILMLRNETINGTEVLYVQNVRFGAEPFTYLWNNGETTSSILISEPGDYSVKITDSKCCVGVGQYTKLGKTACWYAMPENGVQLMMTYVCGIYPNKSDTTISIDSLEITKGNVSKEYIIGDSPTLSLNGNNLNWIPATTYNYMNCNPSNPAYTYTNFVDFLNELFHQYGLNDYSAQNSLIDTTFDSVSNNANCGMYIIRPITDKFNIRIITNSVSQGTVIMNFTNDAVYNEQGIPLMYGAYKNMTCNGIDYDEATNTVIE